MTVVLVPRQATIQKGLASRLYRDLSYHTSLRCRSIQVPPLANRDFLDHVHETQTRTAATAIPKLPTQGLYPEEEQQEAFWLCNNCILTYST